MFGARHPGAQTHEIYRGGPARACTCAISRAISFFWHAEIGFRPVLPPHCPSDTGLKGFMMYYLFTFQVITTAITNTTKAYMKK